MFLRRTRSDSRSTSARKCGAIFLAPETDRVKRISKVDTERENKPVLQDSSSKAGLIVRNNTKSYLAREIMFTGLPPEAFLDEFHQNPVFYSSGVETIPQIGGHRGSFGQGKEGKMQYLRENFGLLGYLLVRKLRRPRGACALADSRTLTPLLGFHREIIFLKKR